MRTMLGFMLQALVDAEATASIGAGPHERTPRPARHSATAPGTRPSARRGGPDGTDPEDPDGVILPSLLAPRRRINVALQPRTPVDGGGCIGAGQLGNRR